MAFFDAAPPLKKQRYYVDESIPALPTELWLRIAEFLPASAIPAFQAVSVKHRNIVKRYSHRLQKFRILGFFMKRCHSGLQIEGHFHRDRSAIDWVRKLTLGESEVKVERGERRMESREVKYTSEVSFSHDNFRETFELIFNSLYDKVNPSAYLLMEDLSPSDVDLLSLVIHRVSHLWVRNVQNDFLARLPSLISINALSRLEITITDKSKVPEDLFSTLDMSKLEELVVQLEEEELEEEQSHTEVGPIALNVTDDWLFRFTGDQLRLSVYSTTLISTQAVNTIIKELQSGEREELLEGSRFPFICDAHNVAEAARRVLEGVSHSCHYNDEAKMNEYSFHTPSHTRYHYLALYQKQHGYCIAQFS